MNSYKNIFRNARPLIIVFFLLFSGFFPAQLRAEESAGLIYLTCKIDPKYKEFGPNIVIDKRNRTMRFLPLPETVPLFETEESYIGKLVADGHPEIFIEFTVNRYTLRYLQIQASASAFGLSPVTTGQCSIENKKL